MVNGRKYVPVLVKWLVDWPKYHIDKTLRIDPKNEMACKSVLLSGPPGCGKTTTANLAAKIAGYETMDVNASDDRSQKRIRELFNSFGGESIRIVDGRPVMSKTLIIFDEVDGMSSGDRGGLGELVKHIKTTKIPFICICNDRQNQKIRTLANHCFDIKFAPPPIESVAYRLSHIAKCENMNVSESDIRNLIEQTNGDIRNCINSLQFIGTSGSEASKKDEDLSITLFDAAKGIFDRSKSITRRENMFFVDHSLVGLFVQQNYPTVVASVRTNELDVVNRLSLCAEDAAMSDVYATRVAREQDWNIITHAAAAVVKCASDAKGMCNFPAFPDFLGKTSKTNKHKNMLVNFKSHVVGSEACRTGFNARQDGHFMRLILKRKFETCSNVTELNEIVDFCEEYGLSRDDVFETWSDIGLYQNDSMVSIDSKLKASFTRELKRREEIREEKMKTAAKSGKQKKMGFDQNQNEDEEATAEDADSQFTQLPETAFLD
jgi:replication factor C subunit 1